MNSHLLYFLILLAICVGCSKNNQNENQNSCFNNNNSQLLTHNGLNREYKVYVPDSYDGSSSMPVVFNFHGYSGSIDDHMIEADLRAVADSDTFLLVYPQGSCLDGASHWNPCPIGGDNKSNADDLGFFEALLNQVRVDYSIDLERVYAIGFSNGAMLSYGLANYKSELVAGVASVSGTMVDCYGPTSHPMPVLHIHGTSDAVLPYNGNADCLSVETVLNHWTSFNNNNPTPLLNYYNGGGIEHYIYNQGDSSVAVEHYKHIGGEHIWLNESINGQNTAQIIWEFLSKYDINGLR
jgi:polyhydroxybutyrate depolymerase